MSGIYYCYYGTANALKGSHNTMMTMQNPVSVANPHRGRTRRFVTSRLFGSLLVGIVITLLLTCIELGVIWFFNLANRPGSANAKDFSTLVALPIHMPLLLLVPVIEVGVISFAAYLAARPLSVLAYLRAIRRAQDEFHSKYTKIDSLAHMYKTPVTFYEHSPDPQVVNQGRNLTLLELVNQSQDVSLLIEGAAGTGKTVALQQYRYFAAKQGSALLRGKNKIPVYVPLNNYSLYLKSASQAQTLAAGENGVGNVDNKHQAIISDELIQQATLIDFFLDSELESIHPLRPYLKKLSEQGRLLFLCDGLDEIDYHYRAAVGRELAEMLIVTQNRFLITCREADYKKVPELEQLVNEGHIERAVISPLQPELVREFVEQYIEAQGDQWQHTAGQIMQVIQSTRLRYLCTNPLILFSFLEIIDKVGVERGRKLDTRGRILREYVAQLIQSEQKRPEWKKSAPAESDVVTLLSRIAFSARWSNDKEKLQLPVARGKMGVGEQLERCADELLNWLKEHPTHGVFGTEQPYEPYDHSVLTLLLQFAQSATLIEISREGILSFRHELIADYFVAQYFLTTSSVEMETPSQQGEQLSVITRDFLTNAVYWSGPVALWAGMVDTPMQLAEQFANLGSSQGSDTLNSHAGQSSYSIEALALGLLCVGVYWLPPQARVQQGSALPQRLTTLMTGVLHNKAALQELASVVTQCAEEGAIEIYRSLMLLLMVDGIEEFFGLLDTAIVPELLFTYLYDTADLLEYEAQVKRLCRVLSYFGQIAVLHAGELSRPVPGRSIRLRAAAINILGATQQPSAVEPLIARLSDREQFIIERTINALIRLGPELSLPRVFQELDNRTPALAVRKAHSAALAVLEFFLNEQDAQQLTSPQYMRVMESLVRVLTSNYAIEQEIQQQAREMLVRLIKRQEIQAAQNHPVTETTSLVKLQVGTQERGLAVVMRYLSSGDEILASNMLQVLQEVGQIATPALLEQLQNEPTEIVRSRIIEVLKKVHDPQALPAILRLVADPSPLVLQQVTSTLHTFKSESVPGLIDLVLTETDEIVAERAAHMLKGMGTEVVVPVTQALMPIVHERTRLLVQILEQIKDERAIPALMSLVEPSQNEPLLAIAVIHALSQYSAQQVVSPLLKMLENPQAQIYEEAIDALSSLGSVALDGLVAELDVQHDTVTTQRIRRALLVMVPFPGERLTNMLPRCSDAQARQVMTVFQLQGADAAQVLVQHLFDKDERTRGYVHQTLNEMQGQIVVPPLLEALNRAEWRDVLAAFLLKYPDVALPPLVNLLGDPERGAAAATILPLFGPAMLMPLIAALDDPRIEVQEHAQNIIIALVHQNPAALSQVVQLFSMTLPLRAHEALLEVLTNDLVVVSIPVLLEGLEDAHLVDDVSEALARLARKRDWQANVLDGLLASLRMEERRRGAETALIKVGGLAVRRVGELIIDDDPLVAKAAQHILQEIGAPALSFIWAAHGDTSNRARREAAMTVFHNMPTEDIKDALVELLTSDQPEDIAMAHALLLERMHDEEALSGANQEMIPALLDYVQIHDQERTSLRILALLFLQGGDSVVRHLVRVLYDQPEHPEQLAYAFLFLGDEAKMALIKILSDHHASPQLRAEAISIVGLLGPFKDVYEYAQSLSKYGLSNNRMGLLNPEELAVSLRALGSLLASGDWDVTTLQHLRHITQEGSPQSDLFNVLLGWRYEPEMLKLKNELQNEREARKSEIMSLTARIVHDQAHIHELDDELKQAHQEHGQRSNELSQANLEKELLRRKLDHSDQEIEKVRQSLIQASQEREIHRANLEKNQREMQTLQEEISQLEAYNALLQQQISLLRGKA
jgi:HEAT repeat protein